MRAVLDSLIKDRQYIFLGACPVRSREIELSSTPFYNQGVHWDPHHNLWMVYTAHCMYTLCSHVISQAAKVVI